MRKGDEGEPLGWRKVKHFSELWYEQILTVLAFAAYFSKPDHSIVIFNVVQASLSISSNLFSNPTVVHRLRLKNGSFCADLLCHTLSVGVIRARCIWNRLKLFFLSFV